MAGADEFRIVVETLLEGVAADTDIASVEITRAGARRRVDVRTRTPGRVIGRRGATADAIRSSMAERLGDPQLQMNIVEVVDDDDPPPDRPAGDREPRRPTPGGPRTAAALDQPVD